MAMHEKDPPQEQMQPKAEQPIPSIIMVNGFDNRYMNNTTALLMVIVYPLCKLAAKYGVQGLEPKDECPTGVWVSDGLPGSKRYNWFELVDKMIERSGK